MKNNITPFWYRVIEDCKEKFNLTDGLTPSFLVGAKSRLDKSFVINQTSIRLLLDEIINSVTKDVAVLQACAEADQGFIIALKDREHAEKMSIEKRFYNNNHDISLCITKDASSKLGTDLENITNNLNNFYLPLMEEGNFSWGLPLDDENYGNRVWREFSVLEKEVIDKNL